MRLIELRLKNLNSLKGEWHIDFADSAFISEGIFAITGQTGAGKTTILDAICLALYSYTPRLGKITNSYNEIMTRGTGECSAEVVIEVNSKKYRCSWYQHRAHKKAKGNLLGIKHEIIDIEADKILEDSKSKTALFIENLIGMDFHQFTRSIMLAQGDFTAFLKSDIDQRSAILEKITGTSIYGIISKNVHEKRRSELEVLNKLQYGLDGLTLLDNDKEDELKATLKTHQSDQNKQQQIIHALGEQIKWLDSVTELKNKLSTYEHELESATQAQQDFIPDAKRLKAANKALEIDSQYSQLSYNRDTVKRLQNDQQQVAQQLPQQQQRLEQADTELKLANERVQEANEEMQTALPKIAQARKLDSDINQQTHILDDQRQRQQTLSANTQHWRQVIESHKQDTEQHKNQLASIEAYLDNARALNDIDTDIANFDNSGSRLKALLQDNAILKKDKFTYQNKADQQQANLDKLHQQQATDELDILKQREQLTDLQQQQAALLQAQSLMKMRHEQEQIDHISSQIGQVNYKAQQLDELSGQINNIKHNLPLIDAELGTLATETSDNESALTDAKDKRQDKQTYLNLLQKVAKLEDYINELEDGQPCPLCGALDHPYRTKNNSGNKHPHSQSDSEAVQIQRQIAELDTTITDLEKSLSQQRIQQATKQNYIEQQQQQLASLHSQTKVLATNISDLIKPLLDKNHSESIALLTNPLGQIATDINYLGQQIDTDNADFSIIKDALSSLINSKEQLAKYKTDVKNTIIRYETLNDDLAEISKTIEIFEQQQYNLSSDISEIETNIKLYTLQIESIDNNTGANFSELKTLSETILSLLKKYLADKSESNVDVNALQSLQALTDSINKQNVLDEVNCEDHIEVLRQQRGILVQLKKRFNTSKEERQNLLTTLGSLNTKIDTKQAQLDKDNDDLDALTETINEKTKALTQLKADRQTIFADKNPNDEEQRLRDRLEQTNTAKTSAQRQLDNADHILKQLQDKKQQLHDRLTTAKTTLDAQENIFRSALSTSDFADEPDFVAARLSIEERSTLNQQQQNIDYRLKQAQSLLKESQQALADKQAEPLTTDNRETLIEQQTQALEERKHLIESIGAISQQLKDNEDKKQNQLAQLEAINTQKNKLKVWQELHKLIGSSDGKLYRTFAQGLTFEIMIKHANTQLHKMSDRYLLIRDDNNALELNVIDNYQGGETRSTKNLSGGEGFIISLALALGLSQMASNNIRVDSLFLDEGFGTLDEESLDIALDTLTSLQQEGKLIGVISHVQALKERILTQIQVKKLSGGFSEITGQGCYRISN